jgi:hypothetical protein
MPLVLTNKLFKSPLGLFFKCCGIARAMPVIINKVEDFIDFHMYAILEFDILVGYPLENHIQEKPSQGGLDEKFGKTASGIPIFHPEILLAKHNPNHNSVEEVKFISPFISHHYEAKRPSSPSPKLEPCPSSQHDITLEKENLWAMDKLETSTLELKMNDSTNEHESPSFEFPRVSCSLLASLELITLSATCFYKDPNLLSILVCELFKRMVVDAFVYHKYYRSHGSIVVLTLQLER